MSFIEDVRRKMPSLISSDEFIEKYGIALRNADGELRSTNEIFADTLRAFETADAAAATMDDFVEASVAHHFLDGVASADEFGKDRWERCTQEVLEFGQDANLRDLRISNSSSDCAPEFAEFCGSYIGDSNAFERTYVGRPYVDNNKGGAVMGIPTSISGVNDKWLKFVNGSSFTFIEERPGSLDDWVTVESNIRPRFASPRGQTLAFADHLNPDSMISRLIRDCVDIKDKEYDKPITDECMSELDEFIMSYRRETT